MSRYPGRLNAYSTNRDKENVTAKPSIAATAPGNPSEWGVAESDVICAEQERTLSALARCHAVYFFAKQLSRQQRLLIRWFRQHTGSGRRLSLVLPWFEADNRRGSRGTVRVPMLVRILRTYKHKRRWTLPKITCKQYFFDEITFSQYVVMWRRDPPSLIFRQQFRR